MQQIHQVTYAKPLEDFSLLLRFEDNQEKRFDVRPLLGKGVFTQLQDWTRFQQVRVKNGTVEWPGEIDLCPNTLYDQSKAI